VCPDELSDVHRNGYDIESMTVERNKLLKS
jgi:hypothetical protein